MMGLYPPGNSGNSTWLTLAQYNNIALGRGMPPMTIRNADFINTNLGFSALPNDFVSIPVTTFIDPDINDMLGPGCKFVEDTVAGRRNDDDVYNNFWYIANFTR